MSGHSGVQPIPTRVLIAEDSEPDLALLKAYLKDGGSELDFASNARIALEKVRSAHPDLLLLDLHDPTTEGVKIACAIRQWEISNQARPLPILALMRSGALEEVQTNLETVCTECLSKPVEKSALLDAIARHIGKIRITPPEGLETLVPDYLAIVRREMNEILSGGDSENYELSRRWGHQSKGEGESYGFPEIARTGVAVELAAMAADKDKIRNQLVALSNYLDRVEIVA
jgi:CheY-like chemotaxis protein